MSDFSSLPIAPHTSLKGFAPPEAMYHYWLETRDGIKIRFAFADKGTKGLVIVCPGRTEYIEKYYRVADEILKRGFKVAIIDWPGQGLSERMCKDESLGHIDSFTHFTHALSDVEGLLTSKFENLPLITLAHSMGGAIVLQAMVDGLVKPKGAAFCAPMWGVAIKIPAIKLIASTMANLGFAHKAVRRHGDESFETNVVTHDEVAWQLNRNLLASMSELECGPPSWSWLNQSLKSIAHTKTALSKAPCGTPIFVASAEEEVLVDNVDHSDMTENFTHAEHILVKNARHEILMEQDEAKAEFWAGFDRLLKRCGF